MHKFRRALRFMPLLAAFVLLLAWPIHSQNGTPHGILVTYNASTATGVTYNVYRGNNVAGPFAKVNTAPISGLSYLDPAAGLSSTQTYVYYTTAVDANGNESVASNQSNNVANPVFPVNPGPPSGCNAKVQ